MAWHHLGGQTWLVLGLPKLLEPSSIALAWVQPSPMVIFPDEEVDAWGAFHNQIHYLLSDRPDEFSPDAFLVSSDDEVTHERLRELGTNWHLVETVDDPRCEIAIPKPPPRQPLYTFRLGVDPTIAVLFQRRYGQGTHFPVQLFREKTSVQFEPPVAFHGAGRFVGTFSSLALGYLPRREPIAKLVSQNAIWKDDGIVLPFLVNWPYEVSIRIPDPLEVINKLLDISTSQWAPSDKGAIATGITSVCEVEELISPGVFEAVGELTTPRSRRLLTELEKREHTTEEYDRALFVVEHGGRFQQMNKAAADLSSVSKEKRVEVAERLVALGWAERGFRIDCSTCRLTSFVSIDHVTDDARCPSCRTPQKFNVAEGNVRVFYRLNGLFDLASDQGVLPHLLAIEALKRLRRDTHALAGVAFRTAAGEGEVDIYGISEGRVVAGEVKTRAIEFTDNEVLKSLRRSSELDVDVHVLACMEELSLPTRALAESGAKSFELELLVLGPKEMRPIASEESAV
jgi:hypothetical protein